MAQKSKLVREEIIEKIVSKKEFSNLPKKDVEKVYSFFEKKGLVQEELVKETRNLLRKMYTAFVSPKLLNLKDKEPEWFLKKHLSTNERFDFYEKVYSRLLKGMKGASIYDLGSGINGFSYGFFPKGIKYFGFEAVGQLVELQNNWFEKEKLDAKCFWRSLFDLEEVEKFLTQAHHGRTPKDFEKKSLQGAKGKKIVFLFKTLDSLEMLDRNYSKKLLKEIMPLVDKIVISFATKSLISKRKFHAERKWLTEFIKKEFKIVDEFEEGNEKYISFVRK